MKTGFTAKAGRCYVTAAQQGDSIPGICHAVAIEKTL